MSTMFHGSNCKDFSDILEHLESLHPTKCALIPNLLTIVHLILINPATLSILSIHEDLTDSINLLDIGNKFYCEI